MSEIIETFINLNGLCNSRLVSNAKSTKVWFSLNETKRKKKEANELLKLLSQTEFDRMRRNSFSYFSFLFFCCWFVSQINDLKNATMKMIAKKKKERRNEASQTKNDSHGRYEKSQENNIKNLISILQFY